MTAAALFALLTARLDSAEKLLGIVLESQPVDVRAELWRRFADDTRWVHDALSKLNAKLESVIGVAPESKP